MTQLRAPPPPRPPEAGGMPKRKIAAAVGTTRQSAHQRYRQLRYDPATSTAWREPPLPL